MSDSKLNKKFLNAVRTGGRSTARTIGSTWKKLRIWQKIGLILCLVFWLASVILGAVMTKITDGLIDQKAAQRWSPGENYSQISAFLAEGSGASEDTVKAMYTGLMLDLQSDAIALSETQIENGASLIEECYCGMGSVDLSTTTDSVTVNAIGVGGNFFNFHPLELMDGYYFSDDDLMQDRVLLDDQTAWRLFGSPNVVGMPVMIGGTPHYIAGVFRQPTKRFYKESGMGSYLVFMSFDSLCKYTEASSAEEEGDGTSNDTMDMSGGMDAMAPQTVPQAVPQTAAYMPELTDTCPDRREVASEEDFGSFDDSDDSDDSGESEEPLKETVDNNDEELSDDPAGGENLDSGGQPDGSSNNSKDGDEGQETPEVNRSRVTCYECVMPNPVSGYALQKVRSRLEQVPFPMEKATIVDNTSRFDILRLVTLMGQPGVRSMQIAPIRYPYWENVALGWEDVLIPYAFLWMFLRYSPLVFLLWLVIWYATHKSWTVGGIVRDIQDRIYDRQSERIYGKRTPEKALETAEAPEEIPEAAEAPEETSDTAGVSAEEKPDVSGASEDRPDVPGVSEDRSEDTLDSSEIPANDADDQPPEDITADDQSPLEQA